MEGSSNFPGELCVSSFFKKARNQDMALIFKTMNMKDQKGKNPKQTKMSKAVSPTELILRS